MIKTWQQRCEEHPDHDGIVSEGMIQARMQEEIEELRAALGQALEALELWEENLGSYKNHKWPILMRDGVITITFIPPIRKVGGGRHLALQAAERVELSQKHNAAKKLLRAVIKQEQNDAITSK